MGFSHVMITICLLLPSKAQRPALLDMVIVVLSEDNDYSIGLAEDFKYSIQSQSESMKMPCPKIHFIHEEFNHPGSWTIVPIIPKLDSMHGKNSSWILFCSPNTKIFLKQMRTMLQKFNPEKEKWIGFGLQDRDATIIHHFSLPRNPNVFKYPSFASGFLFSRSLLNKLSQRLKDGDVPKRADFSIDASFELALYIYNEGKGPTLIHSDGLCIRPGPYCATTPISFHPCEHPVPKENIMFAVKTCSKFHQERLPIVKKTWGSHAIHITFFSDVEDASVGTVSLGVPNTDRGHCAKTMAILNHAAKLSYSDPKLKWIVVVDDDTILSVRRLQELLSCFNASKYVALGERYGYNVATPHNYGGYNYITGGGGMVFSAKLVQKMTKSGSCECPSDSTPDDMFIGICLSNQDINVFHSPLFHQARPSDYAPEYLIPQSPVSFHKHWMVDPIRVYKEWFESSDNQLSSKEPHAEL